MKQKDIALVIVIAFILGIASFLLSNMLITGEDKRSTEVEVVEAISSDLKEPDKKYFNEQSQNPTQLIQIGTGDNPQPL